MYMHSPQHQLARNLQLVWISILAFVFHFPFPQFSQKEATIKHKLIIANLRIGIIVSIIEDLL